MDNTKQTETLLSFSDEIVSLNKRIERARHYAYASRISFELCDGLTDRNKEKLAVIRNKILGE